MIRRAIFLGFAISNAIAGTPDGQQRRIIDDFEDAGTWRTHSGHQKPGTWFAADMFLGSSKKEHRNGNYVGELCFTTDPQATPPYRFGFTRVKAAQLTAMPDGIEFDANPNGHEISLSFVLRDSAGKDFTTSSIPLNGTSWQPYRLDLSPKTVKGWSEARLPVHLRRINAETSQARDGSIFIDDLAFTGKFAEAQQIAVRPVYEGIAHVPEQPVVISYRVWNALPTSAPVTLQARVHTADGANILERSAEAEIPARGHADVKLDFGVLPIGAYQADVEVTGAATSRNLRAEYDDTFAVFTPNGHRINKAPMWMGVQDQGIWESPAERALHMEWMKQLGADVDRVMGGGGRLESREGLWSDASWHKILDPYAEAGIDVLFTFFELPSWMTVKPNDSRTPPRDYARFERHAMEFGSFITQYPAVKYVQFWNEPDSGGPTVSHGFFHGGRDDYLKMFETFSRGFRASNQKTKLTTGGLTLGDEIPDTSRAAIIDQAKDYEIAAFHAHGSLENYETKQRKIEAWLSEAGLNKRILNSESGERSGYTPSGRYRQAVTLVQKIAYAKSRPSSELYLWFTLQDYWDLDPEADDSFGLITSDNRPKPSYVAFNELIRQLANTTPAGEGNFGNNVRALKFQREDGTLVYVLWLQNGSSAEHLWLTVPEGEALTVIDMFGRSEPAPQFGRTCIVPLGAGPIYLRTSSHGEITSASPETVFLQIPPAVAIDGDGGGSISLTFREPQGRPASGQVTLRDELGKSAWESKFILKTGNDTFTTNIPIALARPGILEDSFVTLDLHWDIEGSSQHLTLPIRIVAAYPIRSLPSESGSPFSQSQSANIEALPAIKLDQQKDVVEFAFDPSITPWRGADDLSVATRVAHDAQGLYFRFDVTDDKHVQTSWPERLDRGDSMGLAIASSEGQVTRFHIGLRDNGEQVLWCHRAADGVSIGRWDTPLKISRTGNLTRYEAYLPFEKLGIRYQSGKASPIRFSFQVNEDDGQRPDRWQRRVRYLRWQGGATDEADRLGHGVLK